MRTKPNAKGVASVSFRPTLNSYVETTTSLFSFISGGRLNRKFRWLSTFLVLTLAVLGLTANVAYSQTTGDIEGTVSDTNGSSLPGASVEIKSPALQGTRMAVTDAAGRFRFPVLPSGSYTLTAALSGFTKVEKTNIRVSLGATATLPITMSVSVKEEIVVTGEAPVIDTTKTVIGATLSA